MMTARIVGFLFAIPAFVMTSVMMGLIVQIHVRLTILGIENSVWKRLKRQPLHHFYAWACVLILGCAAIAWSFG